MESEEIIRFIYIFGIILWLILMLYLDLFRVGPLGIGLSLVPIIIFAISADNHEFHTESVLNEILRADYLSFVVLAIVLMINWSRSERKEKIFRIIFTAILFLMLSILDIVGPPQYMIYYRIIKSIFQTIAITLILLALYTYYTEIEKQYKTGMNSADFGDAMSSLFGGNVD